MSTSRPTWEYGAPYLPITSPAGEPKMIIGRHVDRHGRSTGERVAAIHRHGDPVTDAQHADATRLLDAMLDAAQEHGATLSDFDGVVDLPGGCLDVILSRTIRPTR